MPWPLCAHRSTHVRARVALEEESLCSPIWAALQGQLTVMCPEMAVQQGPRSWRPLGTAQRPAQKSHSREQKLSTGALGSGSRSSPLLCDRDRLSRSGEFVLRSASPLGSSQLVFYRGEKVT